jgi:predicted enzyme related to lactoylglutathione lyase
MNKPRNPVGWFEIYVEDMDRAKNFYETTFQVKLMNLESPNPDVEMWVFPPLMASESAGCGGALAKMKDKDAGSGGTIVYFSCDDCAVESNRAEEAGGKVHCEKMPIGQYGFMSLIYDTEGNMIGLHSMK